MVDVIVIAAIVAFFAACGLLVHVLDRMIEGSRPADEIIDEIIDETASEAADETTDHTTGQTGDRS
jgi:hypothetical protein